MQYFSHIPKKSSAAQLRETVNNITHFLNNNVAFKALYAADQKKSSGVSTELDAAATAASTGKTVDWVKYCTENQKRRYKQVLRSKKIWTNPLVSNLVALRTSLQKNPKGGSGALQFLEQVKKSYLEKKKKRRNFVQYQKRMCRRLD